MSHPISSLLSRIVSYFGFSSFCISVRVDKIETQGLSLGDLATTLEFIAALRKGSFLLFGARENSELI